MSFESELNAALQKLAHEIIPIDEHLTEANKCAYKIIELLQSKSKFRLGRTCISSSTSKETTIMDSDVEIVLFVNDELPPFNHVLKEFEKIINSADSNQVRHLRTTKYSIQFKAWGFDFDILPAADFSDSTDIQQHKVLDEIKRDPEEYGYMYSSSLADAAVRFMKQQNNFVHEMVRIAKYWYKTLYFADYILGAKNCVEVVVVHAANQEDNMETKSYLRAFKRFINYMKRFGDLKIQFDKTVGNNERPCVMDPVNPYNNLASNWNEQSIDLMKNYADRMDTRLSWSALDLHLFHLFMPKPSYIPKLFDNFNKIGLHVKWLIDTAEVDLALPDVKIRNERFVTDREFRDEAEKLKGYFQLAIYAAMASPPQYRWNSVEHDAMRAVKQTISNLVFNDFGPPLSSTDKNHENYDITITIPIKNRVAIRVSYRC